jgi:hypothetical protein
VRFHEAVLDEILDERVVSSRGRRNKRGVKRKMSNFPIRRKGPTERLWTQVADVVHILSQQYWG